MLYNDDVNSSSSSQKKKVKKDSNGPGTLLTTYASNVYSFSLTGFYEHLFRHKSMTIDGTIQAVSLTLISIESRDHSKETLQLVVGAGLELKVNGLQLQNPDHLTTLSPLVILTTAYRHTCMLLM